MAGDREQRTGVPDMFESRTNRPVPDIVVQRIKETLNPQPGKNPDMDRLLATTGVRKEILRKT